MRLKVIISIIFAFLSISLFISLYKNKKLVEDSKAMKIKMDSLITLVQNYEKPIDNNYITSLKESVLENSDSLAIGKLNVEYIDKDINELFYYYLVLANKYKDKDACYAVYQCLTFGKADINGIVNFSDLDERTKEMAISYLKLAASYGHEVAMEELKIQKINSK